MQIAMPTFYLTFKLITSHNIIVIQTIRFHTDAEQVTQDNLHNHVKQCELGLWSQQHKGFKVSISLSLCQLGDLERTNHKFRDGKHKFLNFQLDFDQVIGLQFGQTIHGLKALELQVPTSYGTCLDFKYQVRYGPQIK